LSPLWIRAPAGRTGRPRWRARLSGYDDQGVPVHQVVNVALGYCLEFDANQAPENATLRTWHCGSGWTQRWYRYT
jgi:hypothetical protein